MAIVYDVASNTTPKTTSHIRGILSFVGKVKHLSVGDMIDTPTVKAVEAEMYRRGIGDLWGTQLANEIIEAARASLVRRDGPYEVTTPEEAARLAVGAVIDAGEHEQERKELRVAQMIEAEGRVAAW